jgi:hypothetical protein
MDVDTGLEEEEGRVRHDWGEVTGQDDDTRWR